MRRFEISARTPVYGEVFEHFVFLELKAFIDYLHPGTPIHYWRSQTQFEVDFILDEKHAIEVKAKESVSESDLKGLRALKEERLLKTYTCICLERSPRRTDDGIDVIPLSLFLEKLRSGELSN